MNKQKTIFITSFYGLIGRNLLGTDILKTLFAHSSGARVVILLPEEKQKTYQGLFGSDRVIVEGVPSIPETPFELFLAKLFFFLSPTESAKIARSAIREQGKYFHAAILTLIGWLGRIKLIRQLARRSAYLLTRKDRYKKYFNKYNPDLVFATDIFRHQDVEIMREAHLRGVATLGMVRSWDNLSTKGLNHFVPDYVVVQAEKMKEDIVRYGDVYPSKVDVIGVPHYDRYVKDRRKPREEFFHSLNLDPKKKTIILSPPLLYYASDPIAEMIVHALAPFENIQVIVRSALVGKTNLGKLKPIPNALTIDEPESAEDFIKADIMAGDDHLADLLYHCDAMVSHISTLAIDAIVFDKPAFFIGFNTKPMPYHQSVRWFFDMDCARDLIATGGVKLSENVDEFVGQLKAHLADPKLGAEGRQLVRERYCYKLDGKSGERLGNVLAGIVGEKLQ